MPPLPSKNHLTPAKRRISYLYHPSSPYGHKRDQSQVKRALRQVVKRIMIIKRLNILKQVNEVIEQICTMPTNSENEDEMRGSGEESSEEPVITMKKLVKIMNLCQVYVPIVQ
jgi:hypothetical protein